MSPPLPLDYFPVSPLQHGMIRETLSFPQGSGSYVEQIVFNVNQDINIEQFTKAWIKVINHHEILRLGFVWENMDQPLQYIARFDEINIEFNDWSKKSKPEADEFFAMFLQADRSLGFSLDKPPVFRMALLKTDKNQYTCVWSFHHAIADKLTMICILKDLFLTYHTPETQLSPPGSFRNHILRSNPQALNPKAKEFWRKQLKGFTDPLCLPFYIKEQRVTENRRQRNPITLTTKSHKFWIPSDITSILKQFCKKNAITIDYLVMGAWAVLLSHYSGKNNIVLGITRSVRQLQDNGQDHTGLYANTLPVRIKINPKDRLSNFLNKIRNNWIRTKEFENNSLSDIHAWSDGKEDSPLFDILFSYAHYSIDSALEEYKDKISCSNVFLLERTPGALSLNITGIEELLVDIQYDRRRFDSNTIKQIQNHFLTFFESIHPDSDPRIMNISILTDREKKEIAKQLNTFKHHIKPDTCIHHLVDIQVSANKDITAVCDQDISLTYGELKKVTNQIAHYLIRFGAIPETKVVLVLEQDTNLIAAILGVLKSGSAYVPIDPGYPDETINYIIEDCAPKIILTSKIHAHRIIPGGAVILQMEQEIKNIQREDSTPPRTKISPQNLAYIAYPSGLKPTGVLVEHSALVAFARSASEIYDLRPDDRVLQFAFISFDALAQEIFPAILSGSTLVMKSGRVAPKPSQLFDWCRENTITVLNLPTFYWHMIVDEIDTLTIPEQIRLIIIGGNETYSEKIEQWQNSVNSYIRLINTYGPPENTGTACWADLSSVSGAMKEKISIGFPFPNVSLCILNQHEQLAIPGTLGELYIGGTQTARGYHNRAGLTAGSFKKLNHINTETIFFKTGECATFSPTKGLLSYGKIDVLPISKALKKVTDNTQIDFLKKADKKDVPQDSTSSLKSLSPIILIGHSIHAAQAYRKTDLQGHLFHHAPIFIHFYTAENNKALSLDIWQLANKCVKDIKHRFPTGPYIIIGSCQNAIVAHEVASQLKKMNLEIELLVIIDENWHKKELVPLNKENKKGLTLFIKKQVHEFIQFGIGHIFKKAITRLRRYYISLDSIRERLYLAFGKPVPDAIQFRLMENVFYQACESNPYHPMPYDGRVLLFYSNNWVKQYAPKLSTYYKGEVQTIDVNTTHAEWFDPRQIKLIIQQIQKSL